MEASQILDAKKNSSNQLLKQNQEEKNKKLWESIGIKPDKNTIIQLLNEGADPNYIVTEGRWKEWSLLAYAIYESLIDIAILLLNKGSNNVNKCPPLPGNIPLVMAISKIPQIKKKDLKNLLSLVFLLLEKDKANPDELGAYKYAALDHIIGESTFWKTTAAQSALIDHAGCDPLILIKIIELLLEAEVDLNRLRADETTPFTWIFNQCLFPEDYPYCLIILSLFCKKIDPNQQVSDPKWKNWSVLAYVVVHFPENCDYFFIKDLFSEDKKPDLDQPIPHGECKGWSLRTYILERRSELGIFLNRKNPIINQQATIQSQFAEEKQRGENGKDEKKLEETRKLVNELSNDFTREQKHQTYFKQKFEEKLDTSNNKNLTDFIQSQRKQDEKLRDIEKCLALFQELQNSKDQQIINRVRELENDFSPIRKQYEKEQEIINEKLEILKSPSLRAFYKRVEVKLYQFFTASVVLGSGRLDIGGDKTNLGIKFATAIIPFGSLLAGGINAARDKSRAKTIITNVANLANDLMEEKLAERVARALARRYEEQISKLTPPKGKENISDKVTLSTGTDGGAETLAECAIARMISFLLGDKTNVPKEKLTEDQLVNAVFNSTEKNGKLGFMNRSIETIDSKKKWTDMGIFRGSGIKVKTEAGTLKSQVLAVAKSRKLKSKESPCSQSGKYGHRLGTLDELRKLKEAYWYLNSEFKANTNQNANADSKHTASNNGNSRKNTNTSSSFYKSSKTTPTSDIVVLPVYSGNDDKKENSKVTP